MIVLKETTKGYVSLISTLVIGAVVSVITVAILWMSSVSSHTSIVRGHGLSARALADACAEYALQQIRNSTSFSGGGTISIGDGSCSYVVSVGSGEARTISTTGDMDQSSIDLVIEIDSISPLINVTSWRYQ